MKKLLSLVVAAIIIMGAAMPVSAAGGTGNDFATHFDTLDYYLNDRPYSDGLKAVKLKVGGWTFIDYDGWQAFEGMFAYASNFHEGLAVVSYTDPYAKGDGPVTFIDTAGKPAFGKEFIRASHFSEGLAPVSALINGVEDTYYIDHTGSMALNPDGDAGLSVFEDGLAYVMGDDLEDSRVINHQGENAFPNYASVEEFHEGKAVATRPDGRFVFIDRAGCNVFDDKSFKYANDFREGLAVVLLEDDRFGFINHSGELAFETTFKWAYSFYGGSANVSLGSGTYEFVEGYPGQATIASQDDSSEDPQGRIDHNGDITIVKP